MYQCSLPCFSHSFQKWSGVKQNSTLISAEWPWWNLFIFWCFLVFKAEILAWLHCGGLEGYRSSTCMLTFESSRTSFISAWGKCGLGGYFLIKLSEPSHSWYIYPSKISDSCFFWSFDHISQAVAYLLTTVCLFSEADYRFPEPQITHPISQSISNHLMINTGAPWHVLYLSLAFQIKWIWRCTPLFHRL